MTNDEMRVVLGRWAGYNIVDGFYAYPSVEMIMARVPPEIFEQLSAFGYEEIPNYPTSLDAVATLEARLTESEQASYVDWFFHNLPEEEDQGPNPEDEGNIMCVGIWQLLHATAEQRCRGLISILNLSL